MFGDYLDNGFFGAGYFGPVEEEVVPPPPPPPEEEPGGGGGRGGNYGGGDYARFVSGGTIETPVQQDDKFPVEYQRRQEDNVAVEFIMSALMKGLIS